MVIPRPIDSLFEANVLHYGCFRYKLRIVAASALRPFSCNITQFLSCVKVRTAAKVAPSHLILARIVVSVVRGFSSWQQWCIRHRWHLAGHNVMDGILVYDILPGMNLLHIHDIVKNECVPVMRDLVKCLVATDQIWRRGQYLHLELPPVTRKNRIAGLRTYVSQYLCVPVPMCSSTETRRYCDTFVCRYVCPSA